MGSNPTGPTSFVESTSAPLDGGIIPIVNGGIALRYISSRVSGDVFIASDMTDNSFGILDVA
jgi:hypothetical protein